MKIKNLNLKAQFYSLRFRLTALFVLLFGSTLILFSYLLYKDFINTHKKEFDNALYNYTVDVAESFTLDIFGDVLLSEDFITDQEKIFPFSLGATRIFLRDAEGKMVARSSNAEEFDPGVNDEDKAELAATGYSFRTVYDETEDENLRVLTYLVKDRPTPKVIIQVAAPRTLLEREQRGMFTFFSIGIPIVIILSAFLGLFVSRNALNPVKLIIQKANAIEANQLKERVPVPDSRDEIFNLAVTINSLLSRLEKAFQSQERFIADASHQLKTPLAILRGELDLLLKKERSSEEVDAFLRSLSQEIDHLSKMVEDLLLLARTDAGVETFLFEKVRLDEVLIGEVARLEKLARTKSVKLKLNVDPNIKDFEVKGDVDLLKCLFHNVIENAIKYSPESSPIEVDLKQSLGDNDKLIVEVRDQGPGIAPEELDKIFERFHRSANARNLGLGAGLGLAVAKKIADLHGAEIAAKSLKSQGSQFTVQIKNF